MRSRRSISDIVAVVLLIVIAIAAAVIIYMWLSGLIGSVHTSTSAMQVKLEITGGNVTPILQQPSGPSYNEYRAYAVLYNPPDSPSTSITLGEVEFANGTLMCSTNSVTLPSSSPIPPGGSATATFTCTGPTNVPVGTPVEIVLVTSQGTQVTYSTSIVSPQSPG
jgi:flagellin-like protein